MFLKDHGEVAYPPGLLHAGSEGTEDHQPLEYVQQPRCGAGGHGLGGGAVALVLGAHVPALGQEPVLG